MLHLLSSLWSAVTETEETKILFLGNSNSGKSALYERFKIFIHEGPDDSQSQSVPTTKTESNNQSNGLGGLSSLKAEMEKRKLLDAANSSKSNNRNDGDDDDDSDDKESSTSSVDDVLVTSTTFLLHPEINTQKNNLPEQQRKKFHRYFKPNQPVQPLPRFMCPTVGLNVARGNVVIPHSNQKIAATLWDVGGDPSIRQLWYTYIVQCHGVVFTIDLSADAREQAQSVRLLHMLMQRPELAFAPFLVVGTKVDEMIEKEKKNFRQNKSNGDRNSKSRFRRSSIQQTLTQFSRLLHFEQLPVEPTFLVKNDSETDLSHHQEHNINKNNNNDDQQHSEESTSLKNNDDEEKPEQKNTNEGKTKDSNAKSKHEEFIPVNVDSLLTADAIDAVNAVPSGSVSGICGHMYYTAIANSKTLKNGTDLKQALFWILSVAKSSRARAATLQNWESKLSIKSENNAV